MRKLRTRRGALVEKEASTYLADNDGDSDEARVLRSLQAAAWIYRIAFGPPGRPLGADGAGHHARLCRLQSEPVRLHQRFRPARCLTLGRRRSAGAGTGLADAPTARRRPTRVCNPTGPAGPERRGWWAAPRLCAKSAARTGSFTEVNLSKRRTAVGRFESTALVGTGHSQLNNAIAA